MAELYRKKKELFDNIVYLGLHEAVKKVQAQKGKNV